MQPRSYEKDKQHAFDSFCKKVLKHEARDYYDEMKRQRERESSFSELSPLEMEMERFSVMDEYPCDHCIFNVLGYNITIKNEAIAEAIAALPGQKRDIILLAYFVDMKDGEIGKKLNLGCSSVQYKRTNSLHELKKRLEGK